MKNCNELKCILQFLNSHIFSPLFTEKFEVQERLWESWQDVTALVMLCYMRLYHDVAFTPQPWWENLQSQLFQCPSGTSDVLSEMWMASKDGGRLPASSQQGATPQSCRCKDLPLPATWVNLRADSSPLSFIWACNPTVIFIAAWWMLKGWPEQGLLDSWFTGTELNAVALKFLSVVIWRQTQQKTNTTDVLILHWFSLNRALICI